MIPLVAVELVAALTGPVLEDTTDPAVYSVDPACAHIRAADYDYLNDATLSFCEEIVPFYPPYRDKVHILFVVQCESGGDPMANFRRWGPGTEGLFAFMRYLHWGRRILGFDIDPYDTASAAHLASIMVYDGINPKVPSPNFWWWWSCARSYGRPFEAIFGPGTAPERHYCPPDPAYWLRVPPGSNRVCGGVTYYGGRSYAEVVRRIR